MSIQWRTSVCCLNIVYLYFTVILTLVHCIRSIIHFVKYRFSHEFTKNTQYA
jgi:hypothetical protein